MASAIAAINVASSKGLVTSGVSAALTGRRRPGSASPVMRTTGTWAASGGAAARATRVRSDPGSRTSTMTQSTTTAPASNASADGKPPRDGPRRAAGGAGHAGHRHRRRRSRGSSERQNSWTPAHPNASGGSRQTVLPHRRTRRRHGGPAAVPPGAGGYTTGASRQLRPGGVFGRRDPMMGVDDAIFQAHGSRRVRGRAAAHRGAGPELRRTRPRRRQIAGRRAQRQGVRRRRAVREDLGHRPLRHRPRASAQPGHRRPRDGADGTATARSSSRPISSSSSPRTRPAATEWSSSTSSTAAASAC